MMLTSIAAIVAGLLSTPQPAQARLQDAVAVPMQILRTRHIAVQVRINGEGPFRLALDTGSPITFMNRRLAAKLGLMTPEAAKQPMMLGMGGQVKLKSLDIGGVKAADVPVMILDHPIVEMIGQVEGGIEGIIGYTFWARYRMTLDYQAKELTLTPSNYQPQDVLASVLGRLMRADDRPPVVSPGGIWGMVTSAARGRVVVRTVTPGWPAAQAGLRSGDYIRTINRRWTDTLPDLVEALSHAHPDSPAEVVADRAGRELRLKIVPRRGL